MKNKGIYLLFALLVVLTVSCRKDEVTNIHEGLTRIDYEVNNPLEMPYIEFTLDDIHDLSSFTQMYVDLVANEQTIALRLEIMLEDENRHKTDENSFIITDSELIKDNLLHTYEYDFSDHLESGTSSSGEIDISRVSKVVIYINSGLSGTVSQGTFWLDNIRMENN